MVKNETRLFSYISYFSGVSELENKFKEISLPERKKVTRENELCHNCLKPFHVSKDCFGKECVRCNKKHNSLLCPENPQNKLVSSIQLKSNNRKGKKNLKTELKQSQPEKSNEKK